MTRMIFVVCPGPRNLTEFWLYCSASIDMVCQMIEYLNQNKFRHKIQNVIRHEISKLIGNETLQIKFLLGVNIIR